MVVGRLKRESNPLPGYQPGFLPQHERADGEFQATGENHPLPIGNYVQNDSGVWVPVSKQNPMPTQLTGSNVKESEAIPIRKISGKSEVITVFDALSITDTNYHRSSIINIAGARYAIYVRNQLDQDVRIRLFNESLFNFVAYISDSSGNSTDGTYTKTYHPYTMGPFDFPIDTIGVEATCSIAPTSGSLTVKLVKVS